MNVIVLLNRESGTTASRGGELTEAAVRSALAAAGIEAEIRSLPHDQLEVAARAAADGAADIIVAGGGDGTINTVANALAGSGKTLGVLPLGTLNHFAKDLGLPIDLAGAAAVIAGGHVEAVDVGQVNDRVFINNSSIGMYAQAVLVREAERRRGWNKWLAMGRAVLKVFRRFPLVQVSLTTGDNAVRRRTPLVFVGNNRYELDLLTVGSRRSLCEGRLGLYVANTQSRLGALCLAVRAAFGSLKQSRDFELSCPNDVWIETGTRNVKVAIDGEVVVLKSPLHYRTWPAALKVCALNRDAAKGEPRSQETPMQ